MANDYHYDNKLQPKKITKMNVENFLDATENYYCSFNPTQKKFVKEWLNSRSERRLALIFVELIRLYSPSLRTPPGIAELEKAENIILNERSYELRSRLPEPSPMLPLKEREAILKESRAE